MNANKFAVGLGGLALWTSAPAYSQQTTAVPNDDPTRLLVGRLDLEIYKAALRGLGQYGDRQQGTERNRAAVDWIEAQLRSCRDARPPMRSAGKGPAAIRAFPACHAPRSRHAALHHQPCER